MSIEQRADKIRKKYRFELILQPKIWKETCELMRKFDLDVGEVGYKEVITFTSKKELNISEIKNFLRIAIESCDMELLEVEGGKIE